MALALTHFMIHTQKYVWAYKGFCSGVGKINHAHPFFSETFLAPPPQGYISLSQGMFLLIKLRGRIPGEFGVYPPPPPPP